MTLINPTIIDEIVKYLIILAATQLAPIIISSSTFSRVMILFTTYQDEW